MPSSLCAQRLSTWWEGTLSLKTGSNYQNRRGALLETPLLQAHFENRVLRQVLTVPTAGKINVRIPQHMLTPNKSNERHVSSNPHSEVDRERRLHGLLLHYTHSAQPHRLSGTYHGPTFGRKQECPRSVPRNQGWTGQLPSPRTQQAIKIEGTFFSARSTGKRKQQWKHGTNRYFSGIVTDIKQNFIEWQANFNVYAARCWEELHPQLLHELVAPAQPQDFQKDGFLLGRAAVVQQQRIHAEKIIAERYSVSRPTGGAIEIPARSRSISSSSSWAASTWLFQDASAVPPQTVLLFGNAAKSQTSCGLAPTHHVYRSGSENDLLLWINPSTRSQTTCRFVGHPSLFHSVRPFRNDFLPSNAGITLIPAGAGGLSSKTHRPKKSLLYSVQRFGKLWKH